MLGLINTMSSLENPQKVGLYVAAAMSGVVVAILVSQSCSSTSGSPSPPPGRMADPFNPDILWIYWPLLFSSSFAPLSFFSS